MSLRSALAQTVARCAPQEMQRATTDAKTATAAATPVQLLVPAPRQVRATDHATPAQQAGCTPVASPAPLRANSCTTCRHRTRVGTCGQPVAAGLLTEAQGFGIVWPEPGHGATCAAWKLSSAEAIAAVWLAAARGGWTAETVRQWLADADAEPRAVLEVLNNGGPIT